MSDHAALARQIYADLRESATHSLPTEQARERYELWGSALYDVIYASNGHLYVSHWGLLTATELAP
ncbi:MAG: hypothetical protein ABTR07_02300 [Candidatus Competibacter denitrificans]